VLGFVAIAWLVGVRFIGHAVPGDPSFRHREWVLAIVGASALTLVSLIVLGGTRGERDAPSSLPGWKDRSGA
jgi:hypothetical protein